MALKYLLPGLLGFATHEQGSKSMIKALERAGGDARPRRVAYVRAGEGYVILLSFSRLTLPVVLVVR
jgi:hypothetical protein